MQAARLISLSSDSSPRARDELLEQVVNLFDSHESDPTDIELALFSSITTRLINEVSDQICRKVSRQLAQNRHLNNELAVTLAQSDNPDVFEEILSSCEALTEDDLLEVINSKGEGHALSIAKRSALTTTVTDALIETGTSNVVSTMTLNEGAEISQRGLGMIIDRMPADAQVRQALATRSSVDQMLLDQLRQVVETKLGPDCDKSALDDAFASGSLDLYLEQITQARVQDLNNNVQIHMLVQKLERGHFCADDALMEAQRIGGTLSVTTFMARAAGVPTSVLHKSYISKSDLTFSYLLYFIGASPLVYAHIEQQRMVHLGLGIQQLSSFTEYYKTIDNKDARRVVRLMKISAQTGLN